MEIELRDFISASVTEREKMIAILPKDQMKSLGFIKLEKDGSYIWEESTMSPHTVEDYLKLSG